MGGVAGKHTEVFSRWGRWLHRLVRCHLVSPWLACARHFASLTPTTRSHKASDNSAMSGNPLKIRDRQCEEEPEAVDPVSHAGGHHQQAENCRKKLRPEDEPPNQRAEHAKERQTHAKGISE